MQNVIFSAILPVRTFTRDELITMLAYGFSAGDRLELTAIHPDGSDLNGRDLHEYLGQMLSEASELRLPDSFIPMLEINDTDTGPEIHFAFFVKSDD